MMSNNGFRSNKQKQEWTLFRPKELELHTIRKMQSINIHVKVCDTIEDVSKLKLNKKQHECFIIGSKDYCEMIALELSKKDLGWKLNKFVNKTEDDVLSFLKKSFLENVEETTKTKSQNLENKEKKKSDLELKIENLKDSNLSEEDIIGLLMAIDEIQEYRIFPNTEENVYDVLYKLIRTYVKDSETAKIAIDYFIKNPEKFLNN